MSMHKPPFKLATTSTGTLAEVRSESVDELFDDSGPWTGGRKRLGQLDSHLHCSIIGTCLSCAELRKIIARFVDVQGLSDSQIHHEAVSLASQGGPAAKAIHKALDQVHDEALKRSAKVKDAAGLLALWDASVASGEIAAAYWAIMTHREANTVVSQKVFGDVHMLSHRIGAANRADLRRLVALEASNSELMATIERQNRRAQDAVAKRDASIARLRGELRQLQVRLAAQGPALVPAPNGASRLGPSANPADASDLVATHSQRRERAEQALARALADADRLRLELDYAKQYAQTLSRELDAAEAQLQATNEPESPVSRLGSQLLGRKILYVGGRQGTIPAIRDIVTRHGGVFRHHDGGLEDRKGLLTSAAASMDLVVIPVDCVDHDSATNLKKICGRNNVAFLPLRSASVASFAAALSDPLDALRPETAPRPICLKHG